MRNSIASLSQILICFASFTVSASAHAAEQIKVPMTNDRWTTTAGKVDFVEFKGKPSIELKAGNYAQHVPTGAAVLKDLTFRNGTIEYDVAATSDMGAGFVFRRADKDNYEMFYLRPRPKCQEAPDCVQYAPETHGVLLWDVFPQYQGPAPLRMDEWNHIKLVVSGKRMHVYVNGAAEPTLKIGRLEGDASEGGLMLEGPGIFANLVVTPDAVEGLPSEPESDATMSDDRYVRHWKLSPFAKLEAGQMPTFADLPKVSAAWTSLDAERGGLVNASRIYGLPLARADRAVVWLKTNIHSESTQEKHVTLGWLREIVVFVNGQLVFADKNLYQPPAARKTPDGRLSLENGSLMLPLKAGDNEVAVAIVNNFYGWGLQMHFDDVKGLTLAAQ
ncbi:hypothetical protein [Terriglobus saanensis]|uniref:3-keto-disaccharide hydrolase domain-containing protein n=1 Tax=Terriglobus saanensis (strain ATCC BAA-1853 / DSM 23119 / SP1PR4) TaxID=401053 RepID=E8V2R7_TERSS|nr:hypothetical protein [Terriglobus saanensis]ADV83542.1 hypothetical protein AciPR4_2769 [Terriglobus saanensis SP1PR4]